MTAKEINTKIPPESRWKAISTSKSITYPTYKRVKATFLCICGTKKMISVSSVVIGHSKSCGCLQREINLKRITKHSVSNRTICDAYHSMINRCYNTKNRNYPLYGGRGVVVCEEWRHDYESFLHWSLNNGWQKGLELDKDILGNGLLYSPSTCKWATKEENVNYTRASVKYDFYGEILTLPQICRKTGLNISTLRARLRGGLSIIESTQRPIKEIHNPRFRRSHEK
jgi:hypothetical protein